MAGPPVRAERAQERPARRLADDEQREADRERHPERLRGQARRTLVLARTARPRHHRGRAVREEVEDRERAREHRACKAESGDLRAAEMADDGCVGEHV